MLTDGKKLKGFKYYKKRKGAISEFESKNSFPGTISRQTPAGRIYRPNYGLAIKQGLIKTGNQLATGFGEGIGSALTRQRKMKKRKNSMKIMCKKDHKHTKMCKK